MSERKIIFKAKVGSHLYGTNRPESDDDYLGVFLHSKDDLLGLDNPIPEWTENVKNTLGDRNSKGDVDCKYYSVKRFLKLVAQGQPGALELFFVPPELIQIETFEFMQLREFAKTYIFSKHCIVPFIGFAMSQAYKAFNKGENLNKIVQLITAMEAAHPLELNKTILEHLDSNGGFLLGVDMEMGRSVSRASTITIAHRQFDVGNRVKNLLLPLKKLRDKYGIRSQAAAAYTYDFKSLCHTYRLLAQAEEFLLTGTLTFPRPEAEFLKSVIDGKYITDFYDKITLKTKYLKDIIEPQSKLRDEPDWKAINDYCIKMHFEHLTA